MPVQQFALKILVAGTTPRKWPLVFRLAEGVDLPSIKPGQFYSRGDFVTRTLEFSGNIYKVQLWDFWLVNLSQARSRTKSMRETPLITARGAAGALLLDDMADPSPLEILQQWVDICRSDNKEIPIIFCTLLPRHQWEEGVTLKQVRTAGATFKFTEIIEIPPEQGENIESAFQSLLQAITTSRK